MSCIESNSRELGVLVHIHTPDYIVDLEPYGSRVWLEFHRWTGPAFFRGHESREEIRNPSRKTWRAFEAWHREAAGK